MITVPYESPGLTDKLDMGTDEVLTISLPPHGYTFHTKFMNIIHLGAEEINTGAFQ